MLTGRAQSEPDLVRYLPYCELSPLLSHVLMPYYHEAELRTLLEVLSGLLQWDPDCRWTAAHALEQLWDADHPASATGRAAET